MTDIGVRFEVVGRDVADIRARAHKMLDQLAGPHYSADDVEIAITPGATAVHEGCGQPHLVLDWTAEVTAELHPRPDSPGATP